MRSKYSKSYAMEPKSRASSITHDILLGLSSGHNIGRVKRVTADSNKENHINDSKIERRFSTKTGSKTYL